MDFVTIGCDVGQLRDPTAIAVIETERRPPMGRTYTWHCVARHLERLPLGTSYPDVAARVAVISAAVCKRLDGAWPTLYVDATGVGTPLVDVLREGKVKARIVPVYFTHGDRRTEADGEVKLGKAWLVSRMQALLQQGRLHLPRTSEADALARELLDYEIRIDENANDRYGAFKVGSHDHMVTAIGLALQVEPLGSIFAW